MVQQQTNEEDPCAVAAALNGSQHSSTSGGSESGDSLIEAASGATAVLDASAAAAEKVGGDRAAFFARTVGPIAGPVGNAIDASTMTTNLLSGDIDSAAYTATDIYVGTNLLKIPEYEPLLAGAYAVGGGSRTVVKAALAVNLPAGIKAVAAASAAETCAREKAGAGAAF